MFDKGSGYDLLFMSQNNGRPGFVVSSKFNLKINFNWKIIYLGIQMSQFVVITQNITQNIKTCVNDLFFILKFDQVQTL